MRKNFLHIKRWSWSFAVSVLLCLTWLHSSAQTHHQALYWLRYQTQINFSPNTYWTNDIDNRRFFDPDVQNQLIIHSRFHYKIKHWDFGAGITYSIAYAAIPEDGYNNTVHELRPVLEASYEIPIGKVLLAQRARIDNRIFEENPEENVFESSFYVMRFRYRLQARFPLLKNEDNVQTIGLRIADEIMFNDRQNSYDQSGIL